MENHWRPVSNDNVVYPNFMIQLMHSIVRIHLGFSLNFSFALSAKQTQHLKDLLTVLGDDASTDCKRMISYHELAWLLVDADLTQCIADCWANPIQQAVWLRALRIDGNFQNSSTSAMPPRSWKCSWIKIGMQIPCMLMTTSKLLVNPHSSFID